MIDRFTSIKKGLAVAAVLAGTLGLSGCGSCGTNACGGRVVSVGTGNCAPAPIAVMPAPAPVYASYAAPAYTPPAAINNGLYYDGPVAYSSAAIGMGGVGYGAPAPINYAPPTGAAAANLVVHSGNPLSHLAGLAGGGAVTPNYPLVSYDGYKEGAYASYSDYIPAGPNEYVVPGSLRTINGSKPVATTQAGGLAALASSASQPAAKTGKALPPGRRGLGGAPRFSEPIPSTAVAAAAAAAAPVVPPAPGPVAIRTATVVPVPASTPIMEPPMDSDEPAPVPAVVSEPLPASGLLPPILPSAAYPQPAYVQPAYPPAPVASLVPAPVLGGGDLYVTPGDTQVNTYVPGPDPAGYYGGGIEPLETSGLLASDPAVHYTTRATCNVVPLQGEAVVWTSGF